MRYRKLGKTGLKVSRLCLGAMTFGAPKWGCDEATSQEIVDRFVDAGGNFIDTADVYSMGVSEEITGRAIKSKRQEIILATKCSAAMGKLPNDLGTSRKHILDAVDASLRRLGTDYIDLYQVHGYDPTTPLDETIVALNDCVRAGKVRYIGCSNYSAWHLAKANAIAKENGLARFDCLQPQYSLICREIEREHIPLCRDEGIGTIPWSPLAGGILTGKFTRGDTPADGTRTALAPRLQGLLTDEVFDIVDVVKSVAKRFDKTTGQVALAWAVSQPGVTSPIFGARTIEQLEDNLGAEDIELDQESLSLLDEVSALPPTYPYEQQADARARARAAGYDID